MNEICPTCNGSGGIDMFEDSIGEIVTILCPDCGGVGEAMKMQCYFCGEKTEGKKFLAENLDTHEKEILDVCESCYDEDLELVIDHGRQANGY